MQIWWLYLAVIYLLDTSNYLNTNKGLSIHIRMMMGLMKEICLLLNVVFAFDVTEVSSASASSSLSSTSSPELPSSSWLLFMRKENEKCNLCITFYNSKKFFEYTLSGCLNDRILLNLIFYFQQVLFCQENKSV